MEIDVRLQNLPPPYQYHRRALTEHQRALFDAETVAFAKIEPYFGPGPYSSESPQKHTAESEAKWHYRQTEQFNADRRAWAATCEAIDNEFPRI